MAGAVAIIRKTVDLFRRGNYSSESVDGNKSVVLDYIHGYYEEALDRLPPSLIPRVHEAGVCFGFLDPVSNIIANTAAFKGSPSPAKEEANQEEQRAHGKKRKRSQAGTSSKEKGKRTGSKSEEATPQRGEAISAEASSIAVRSLQGLVTFLTTYFRYLYEREALRYLRLAKADLLVAVHLIQEDRDTDVFTLDHLTTKIALSCAAISAVDETMVTRLVSASLSLASHLDEVAHLLAIQGRLCASTLRRISKLSMQWTAADPREPMRHAVSRCPSTKKTLFPFELELALMRVLLDRIHGFYLKAISCIPAPFLRALLHRGLLKAGHCYGPFDPVTNIILNTIWYDTAFPTHQVFEVDMICDESLVRTECRSLNGLVNFVTTLFPALSRCDAVRYLLLDNAGLDSVISRAKLEGYQASTPLSDAYKAAARAAHHPDPAAVANLASGLFPEEGGKLKALLKAKRTLSPDDVQTISAALSQKDPPSKPVCLVQELTPRASQIVSAKRKEFEAQQRSVRRRVQAALQKHAQEKREEYELVAICGANAEIPEDGCFGHFDNYDGYPYSHINIWARLKGSQFADADPTLLFIQCRNDSKNMEDVHFLCLQVSESSRDAGRCFHCEYDGSKIVHPSSQTYLGQGFDFEDMARGEHSVANGELTGLGERSTVFVDTWEDDCIYFDPAWDALFAARLNRNAKREEGEDKDSARAQANKLREAMREMAAAIKVLKTDNQHSSGHPPSSDCMV